MWSFWFLTFLSYITNNRLIFDVAILVFIDFLMIVLFFIMSNDISLSANTFLLNMHISRCAYSISFWWCSSPAKILIVFDSNKGKFVIRNENILFLSNTSLFIFGCCFYVHSNFSIFSSIDKFSFFFCSIWLILDKNTAIFFVETFFAMKFHFWFCVILKTYRFIPIELFFFCSLVLLCHTYTLTQPSIACSAF